jgi:hypothetical protein
MSKGIDLFNLIPMHSNEIIIRKYVKFDENILACIPNSVFVPSSSYEPSSTFVPSLGPILVSSSDDESEDENPPPPSHFHPNESIEHEPALIHIHSSSEPPLLCFEFQRLMIQTHLYKIMTI